MDLVKLLKPELDKIPGFIIYASPGATMISGGGDADQVQFVLKTTRSQEELDTASSLLEYALRSARIFPRLNTDRGDNIQEYTIDINRDKAGLLGIDVNTIGETFDTFVSGRRISDFRRESELFDVLVSVKEENRRSVEDLSGMYVRGTAGQYKDHMIPLTNLVTIKKELVPVRINHFNQLLSVTLSGALPDNISLGTAVEKIQEIANKILPEGIQTEFTGETKQYLETRYDVFWIFGLAIVFIYLIMAAQFESFKAPLIIMFTVPLSLAGAIITLKLVGGTINIYSQIGLITLIGLITKHGILIVDFANKIQENEDKSIQEAVMQAAKMRLRPILMTTAAMVLGAIPLVLASGAGAISRQQIGWVIFGGMLLGTFFTLFVIPLIYTLLAKKESAV
jgi:multidrug efflux pump